MYNFSKCVVTFASTAVLLFALPVGSAADPIRIIVERTQLEGVFFAGNPQGGGGDIGFIDAWFCHPCTVGQKTSFATNNLRFIEGPFMGTFRTDGTTVELGGDNEARFVLTLTAPSFVLPNAGSVATSVTTPFQYVARWSIVERLDDGTFERRGLFSANGSGLVTGSFSVTPVPEAPGGRVFDFLGATYEIGASAPTPEPTSLVLLGAGMGGVLIRGVRRRLKSKWTFPPEAARERDRRLAANLPVQSGACRGAPDRGHDAPLARGRVRAASSHGSQGPARPGVARGSGGTRQAAGGTVSTKGHVTGCRSSISHYALIVRQDRLDLCIWNTREKVSEMRQVMR